MIAAPAARWLGALSLIGRPGARWLAPLCLLLAAAGCQPPGASPLPPPSTAGTSPPPPAAGASPFPPHSVDLTHPLSPSFPFIPIEGKTFAFREAPIATLEADGVYANRWELTEHVGTHLDAPSHFAAGGVGVDAIGLSSLMAPLAVLDLSARAAADPDTTVEVADLLAWEQAHGRLPAGAALLVWTGWDARASSPEQFVHRDAAKIMHFPGFSPALIDFLIAQRDIRGIGIDTLSIDPGRDAHYPAHRHLFAAGKWAIECVANLAQVPAAGAWVLVAPVKVVGASGAPARVFAFW